MTNLTKATNNELGQASKSQVESKESGNVCCTNQVNVQITDKLNHATKNDLEVSEENESRMMWDPSQTNISQETQLKQFQSIIENKYSLKFGNQKAFLFNNYKVISKRC